MSTMFGNGSWKWAISAGLVVGLLGLYAPASADDDKDADVKKVVIKKDGDEPRKEGERKDGDRKDGDVKKGEGKQGDDRIDELARFVKQLAGQVNELRQEVQALRSGGIAGFGIPEEARRKMEEMPKKFAAGGPGGLNPEKFKEEMEKRYRAEQEKFAARIKEGAGADAEAQIRRQIEQLQGELKRIIAAREREGAERKKEGKEEEEEREAKERAAKKEAAAREAKEREAKEREGEAREAKEKEAKAREAKEREAKEGADKKPEGK